MAIEIRKDLALPAKAREETDRRVADVTTHSTEAYRFYLEGYDYHSKYYWQEAEQSFRKAIEHDPTFAMAYYMLAKTLNRGERAGAVGGIVQQAVAYSDKVGLREKFHIDAFAAMVSRNHTLAIKTLEKLLKQFPYDKRACIMLGFTYFDLQDYKQVIHYANRAIGIDPLYKEPYNLIAYSYNRLGEIGKANRAIDKFIKLFPGEANPHDSRGDIYAYHGKLDKAIESYQKASQIKPGLFRP